jgi:hypothetical protein
MTTTMYNTFLRGIVLAVLALGMFFNIGITQVHAETDGLVVDFSGGGSSAAIFGSANFLPGDTVSGYAKVTNNTGSIQGVLTSTASETDTDGLGDVLMLSITKEGESAPLYENTLSHFFSHEIELGDLDNGNTQTYYYSVLFPEGSGNETQKEELGFDVCVGFSSDEYGYQCGTQISDGEDDDGDDEDNGGDDNGGGGGGGGIIESSPLKIMNERVEDITLPQTTVIGNSDGTATVLWDTYRNGELEPATSQVIYGLKYHVGDSGTDYASGYPYSINLTQPNFGYPEATVEDTNKVTHHEMTLTGLEVGATYAYRVVSHASPATVSYQHEFTIPYGEGENEPSDDDYTDEGSGIGGPLADGGTVGGGTYTPPEPENVLPGDSSEDEELLKDNGNGLLPAGLGFLPASFAELAMCAFWFILILVIIAIIWRLYRVWRERNGYEVSREEDLRLWIICDIIAIFILYLFGIFCPIIPLAILLLVFIIWCIKRRLGKPREETVIPPSRPHTPAEE